MIHTPPEFQRRTQSTANRATALKILTIYPIGNLGRPFQPFALADIWYKGSELRTTLRLITYTNDGTCASS
jgi:hypothetical protein